MELITLIQFSNEEKTEIAHAAKARYESNRNAKNKTSKMYPGKKNPYYGDMIGAAGELAVCKMLGLPWTSKIFDQAEFNKIKNDICDVGSYEVRSTDVATGRLILNDKDLKHKASKPFIFVVIHVTNYPNGSVDVVAEIKGWITAKEGIEKGTYWKGKYGVPAYYVGANLLNPIDQLPAKEADAA